VLLTLFYSLKPVEENFQSLTEDQPHTDCPKELNERLEIENKKLAEIVSLHQEIDKINTQKNTLFELTVQNHISFATKIDDLIRDFSLVHDDIKIKIEKTYQRDKCKELLKDLINLQSHDRQSFVNDWGSQYVADPQLKIESFLQQALENKIELKAHKEIKDLTKGLYHDFGD
jgi:glycine cleavage system regulatory protein